MAALPPAIPEALDLEDLDLLHRQEELQVLEDSMDTLASQEVLERDLNQEQLQVLDEKELQEGEAVALEATVERLPPSRLRHLPGSHCQAILE